VAAVVLVIVEENAMAHALVVVVMAVLVAVLAGLPFLLIKMTT
jgi:hypothetical protein